MSREKQIEELGEAIFLNCNACLLEDEAKMIAKFVIEEQGHRKQSEAEWISVEERLPDENGRFLTVDKKGDMMVCFWEKHFGWFAMVCNKNAITHWMPLPEPPDMKGGE